MTRFWPDGIPIQIWGDAQAPTGFTWEGTGHPIIQICNRWRVHTRWWEPGEAVHREYLKVVTESGLLCLISNDLASGTWFLCRLYD